VSGHLEEGLAPVPLVLLTGFLGAGKTTILNRVLAFERHRRLGVIVNELGRIDIDGKLLKARSGDVIELVGGCVCHQVRTQEELWSAVAETIDRARPDVILLETTGIAEPEPILEAFEALPAAERRVFPSAVITVVDSEAALEQLDRHGEARRQVRAADGLLLTKLDLVGADQLLAVHRTLERMNPGAERASFPATDEGTGELVSWLLAVRRAPAPADAAGGAAVAGDPHHHHPHHHDHGQLVAVGYTDEAPLLAEPLLGFCRRLGPALVRAKGWVHVAGETRRGFLERAGHQLALRFEEPWPPGPRRTELVFIGEGLDAGAVRRQLWSCRVNGPTEGVE
jgi:G3E family GTPase